MFWIDKKLFGERVIYDKKQVKDVNLLSSYLLFG